MNEIQFNVPNASDNIQFPIRLDTYAASVQGISRSRLKTGIKSILINKKAAKLSAKLSGGEFIELTWEDPIPQDIMPQNIPLNIIYEDENVTIVNKKQGMVVHPATGNWDKTLVNALLYHWGRGTIKNTLYTEKKNTSVETTVVTQAFRPGIVHRLDKDTSGCLITAKNRNEEAWLQNRFKTRQVQKDYICIVCGHPPKKNGSIKTQIVRDSRNRKKFTTGTDPKKGKFAHSLYHCIAIYGPYSLMRIRLKTGRTHQIRVHMKYIGCPILGDPIYGKKDSLFASATLMLHARTLGIQLTEGDSFRIFKSPVPIRFKKVLKILHGKYDKCTLQ
ncbi:MAG: RNA pseudouridine synthase [Treponema sp. CETP13]|nr:MAG: RNA pseudouridine synthase [Treponema sp. CETP13]